MTAIVKGGIERRTYLATLLMEIVERKGDKELKVIHVYFCEGKQENGIWGREKGKIGEFFWWACFSLDSIPNRG